MEGYFVRTLGMHRVYNSAFMVMLRDEDNAKYRSVIKNTLEFDPDIMKRYVNFMSNPDERTAIDQFGKGDKCFGVAALMATLPGLPMFGHGRLRDSLRSTAWILPAALRREADHWLVERHEREIAPLLKRRWLFAESSNFLLYDFFQATVRWTRISSPTPIATAVSAHWWSSTTAMARPMGRLISLRPMQTRALDNFASRGCGKARAERGQVGASQLPRFADGA